jgi:hypothetical protein
MKKVKYWQDEDNSTALDIQLRAAIARSEERVKPIAVPEVRPQPIVANSAADIPDFMSVKEIAKKTRQSADSVSRDIRSGMLPARKMGKASVPRAQRFL